MIRFVDIVARTLPTNRLKAIAQKMLLSEDEEYLLIERCAKMKTREQCIQVSPHRQRELMSILNTKMQLSLLPDLDGLGENTFLTEREKQAIKLNLSKNKRASKEK